MSSNHHVSLHCMILPGIVWYFKVLHCSVWYCNCMVLYGIVKYCIALYGIAIAWYSGFLPPSQPVTSSWRLPGQIMSAWQVWNLIHKSWKCYECWWAAWILLQLICQERAFYSSCAIYGYCLSTSCNSLYIFAPLLLYQTMQAPNEHIIYGYCNTL